MLIEFVYNDNYISKFEVLESNELETISITEYQKIELAGFENCYENSQEIFILSPQRAFRFNLKKDAERFLKKTAYFKIDKINKLIFFELIDNKELLTILELKVLEEIGFSKSKGNKVYRLFNKKILSADIYYRSGELYQNYDDYIAISESFF